MTIQLVRTDDLGAGIVRVTIDRPPVNAVNTALYQELRLVFESFMHRVVDVVILTGAGKTFSAGNDLSEFAVMDPGAAETLMYHVRRAFWAIYDCPVPVVASVNGAALGTGFALVTCCDVVVASDRARFGLPELNVGVLGGAKFGARLLPELAMRRLFFTGQPVPADELVRMGAAIELVPHEALEKRSLDVAAQIAEKSPAALRLAKRALNSVESMDLKAGYEYEQTFTIRMSGHPDSKEAVRAVIEKRPAKYPSRDGGA